MLRFPSARGFSLLEVLIAILLTAFGLLGLAGLMSKMQVAETEGYNRSQAMSLLWDMSERLTAAAPTSTNAANAYFASSQTKVTVGTGNSSYTFPCTGTGAAFDLCNWNFALQGGGECKSGSSSASTGPCGPVTNNVGAMNGARGCIELLTPPNNVNGTCTPATFRVSVAWQGLVKTVAPTNTCGQGSYTDDAYRRVVSQQITIGMPFCTL